jgi:hypothetical protein
MDCSNCANVVNGSSPVCRILNKVYPISDYPNQGVNCVSWTQSKAQRTIKENKRDPLLSWIGKFKKTKEKVAPIIDEKKQEVLKKIEDDLLNPDVKNKAYLLGIREELKNPIPTKTQDAIESQPVIETEVNFKNSLGWVIASVLGAVLISLWLLGLIG